MIISRMRPLQLAPNKMMCEDMNFPFAKRRPRSGSCTSSSNKSKSSSRNRNVKTCFSKNKNKNAAVADANVNVNAIAMVTADPSTTAAACVVQLAAYRIDLPPTRLTRILKNMHKEYVKEEWQLPFVNATQWKAMGAPIGLVAAIEWSLQGESRTLPSTGNRSLQRSVSKKSTTKKTNGTNLSVQAQLNDDSDVVSESSTHKTAPLSSLSLLEVTNTATPLLSRPNDGCDNEDEKVDDDDGEDDVIAKMNPITTMKRRTNQLDDSVSSGNGLAEPGLKRMSSEESAPPMIPTRRPTIQSLFVEGEDDDVVLDDEEGDNDIHSIANNDENSDDEEKQSYSDCSSGLVVGPGTPPQATPKKLSTIMSLLGSSKGSLLDRSQSPRCHGESLDQQKFPLFVDLDASSPSLVGSGGGRRKTRMMTTTTTSTLTTRTETDTSNQKIVDSLLSSPPTKPKRRASPPIIGNIIHSKLLLAVRQKCVPMGNTEKTV